MLVKRFFWIVLAAFFVACSSNHTAHEETKEVVVSEAKQGERIIVLEGAKNFRDLGGYATATGETLAWNRLYRSDKLSELTEKDLEKIAALGIKTVIDLRSDFEVQREADKLPAGIQTIRIPMWLEEWNMFFKMSKEQQDSLQKAANTAKVNAMVAEGYSKFPIEFKNQSAEFLEILSKEENYPILFHCTAGTDRTGYLASLTLSILGVDRAVIEDDYALSAKLRLNQEEKDTRIVTTLDKINELGGIGKYVESLPKNVDTYKIKGNLLQK